VPGFTDPGNVDDAVDVALIQLIEPTTLFTMNRHSGTVASLLDQSTFVVGYGATGTGTSGVAANSSGIKRGANNVIDRQGSALSSSFSNNLILTDFDGPSSGDMNRWGSDDTLSLEGAAAFGDSGGPWYVGSGSNRRLAGVTSFGDANPLYGAYNAATAVSPHNDWINSAMGGVNWNNRTTVGYVPFNSASAWGDGQVPASGDSVQFSLPFVEPFLFGAPYISFTQNTTVGTMTVEFGPHTFTTGANTLTTNGAINVDDDGTFVLNGGVVRALPVTGMRVGRNTTGSFVQNGGTVDVDQNMYVGTNAGSNGEYELNNGNLQVQGTLSIGYAGSGAFIHDGGEVDAVTVIIGDLEGSSGHYALNSNSAVDVPTLDVGNAGTGRFEQHNGDVYVSASHIRIGRYATGNGTYEIDGGRLRTASGLSLYVGFDGLGTFVQNGGVVEGANTLQLAVQTGSEGHYVASGGTATFGGTILVGRHGVAQMDVSNNATVSGPDLVLARDGGSGEMRQSGGLVNITAGVYLTFSANAVANYFLTGGELRIGNHLDVGIAGEGHFHLQGGELDVSNGAINLGLNGDTFQFTGGTLHVGTYNGNLVNNGGVLSPGNSAGSTQINGDYNQAATNAALEIEIGGLVAATNFDIANVTGAATLGGSLALTLIDGFTPSSSDLFTVFDAASIVGQFVNVAPGARVDTVDGLGSFVVNYGTGSLFDPTQIVLSNFAPPSLVGDYNQDDIIDAADYVVWRKMNGPQQDYDDWRENFGASGAGGSLGFGDAFSQPAVPEPTGLVLVLMGCWMLISTRRFSEQQ
jgi:hypothetical protein